MEMKITHGVIEKISGKTGVCWQVRKEKKVFGPRLVGTCGSQNFEMEVPRPDEALQLRAGVKARPRTKLQKENDELGDMAKVVGTYESGKTRRETGVLLSKDCTTWPRLANKRKNWKLKRRVSWVKKENLGVMAKAGGHK